MIVLVGAPRQGEAPVSVLHVAPEQVVQGPQRVEFDVGERIASGQGGLVLESEADGPHRLREHRLLVPVGPDELEQAGPLDPEVSTPVQCTRSIRASSAKADSSTRLMYGSRPSPR